MPSHGRERATTGPAGPGNSSDDWSNTAQRTAACQRHHDSLFQLGFGQDTRAGNLPRVDPIDVWKALSGQNRPRPDRHPVCRRAELASGGARSERCGSGDVDRERVRAPLARATRWVLSLAFAGRQTVYSGATDETIRLWDRDTEGPCALAGEGQPFRCVVSRRETMRATE